MTVFVEIGKNGSGKILYYGHLGHKVTFIVQNYFYMSGYPIKSILFLWFFILQNKTLRMFNSPLNCASTELGFGENGGNEGLRIETGIGSDFFLPDLIPAVLLRYKLLRLNQSINQVTCA